MNELINEKIVDIVEADFVFTEEDNKWYKQHMEGFKIVTNEQEILLGINGSQACCENFGYFMTNDNIKEFIGATIREIHLTDTLLKVKKFKKEHAGNIMFVNIETDKGTLQFVAYNDHNGYYGHDAIVLSKQLKHQENL